MTHGYGAALVSPLGPDTGCFGTRRTRRIRSSCRVPFGVEASSPSKDQGVCLTLVTTALDDEVPIAAYGP